MHGKIRKITFSMAASLGLLLAGAGVSLASPAAHHSAKPHVQASPFFKLYANGTSTAKWDDGAVVLDSGATPATDGAYVLVNGLPAYSQAPKNAPLFTSSPPAAAGDPRWVIEFHNGCYLFGDDGSSTYWSEEPGGAQHVTYAVARTWATQACGLDNWVTAAFIVDDSGNHGIKYTLAKISYGSHSIAGS